jgi:hypothetical protein
LQSQLTRMGLIVLMLGAAVVGFWAVLAPESFYDDFPGGGRSWVNNLEPYNEHLVRDVGALNLGLAVVLGWAAVTLVRPLVVASLVAFLVTAVPHFFFHLFNLDDFSTSDAVGQTLSLGFLVVLPLFLLWRPVAAMARERNSVADA